MEKEQKHPRPKTGFLSEAGKRKSLSEGRERGASQEIEAVIESFQELTDMNVAQYTSGGAIKMIDH
jgi:hypothetical protein